MRNFYSKLKFWTQQGIFVKNSILSAFYLKFAQILKTSLKNDFLKENRIFVQYHETLPFHSQSQAGLL